MHPAAGWVIPIVAISVCSVPVNQTLNEDRPCIKPWLPWVDWDPSLIIVRAPIIILPGHIRSAPRRVHRHSTTVITAESMIILLMVLTQVLLLAVSTTLTPQRRSWTMSRLDYVCHHRSAMDPIP